MVRGESRFFYPVLKGVLPLLPALSPQGLGGGAWGEHVRTCTIYLLTIFPLCNFRVMLQQPRT